MNESKRSQPHSQGQMEHLFSIIPSILIGIDPEGTITRWNRTAETVFGLTREQVLRRPILGCGVSWDVREIQKGMQECGKNNRQIVLRDIGFRKPDGSRGIAGFTINPVDLKKENKNALSFLLFGADVTQARRVERRLEAENAVTRVLSESPEIEEVGKKIVEVICGQLDWEAGALWRVDPERKILSCTKAHCVKPDGITFCDREAWCKEIRMGEDLPGRVWAKGKPLWTSDVSRDTNCRLLTCKKPFKIRSAFAFPIILGGRVTGVMEFLSSKVLLWDKETLRTMKNTGHQIGQFFARKKAEEELRESRQLYADLVENAPDPIVMLDTRGFILKANAAAEQASGYTVSELVGKHLARTGLLSLPSLSRVIRLLRLTVRGRKQPPVELEIIRKDKKHLLFEVNSRAILRETKVTGIQVILRDMTERRHLEERMLQSQKMQTVGQLAGGIAHDFNNILTVINGYAGYQLENLEPGHPARSDAEEILKAGERAVVLIGQLMAFSRGQSFQSKIINLNDLIKNMGKMFERLIAENIEFKIVPASDLGVVKTDPNYIEQVLTNLVVNACQAMPAGGRLTVETRNVTLDEEYARHRPDAKPGEYVLLAVSDTGVGITPEVRGHLFEPFFTTKEKGKGTGLGLATSYGIVKQSGGSIDVYSEPGQGASFKVYLPRINEPAEVLVRPEKSGHLPRGTETVLVVEDETAVRNFIERVLSQQGYTVLEASNGVEAIRMIAKHGAGAIDLLITDMVMPGVGGRELVDRLKSMCPKMKVIFISGYTESISIQNGALKTDEAFVQKPFSSLGLSYRVREVLNK